MSVYRTIGPLVSLFYGQAELEKHLCCAVKYLVWQVGHGISTGLGHHKIATVFVSLTDIDCNLRTTIVCKSAVSLIEVHVSSYSLIHFLFKKKMVQK